MGGVSSISQNPNILDQIKNKDYSVININDKPNSFDKTSLIKVTELKNIRTISGTGACTPLPPSIVLKPGNSLNKNIFVSRVKGQHIRLYADRKCRKRANEEEYADLNPPKNDLFYPNYTGTDTEFTFVPYQSYQNAHFYRITDQVMNTPGLPQFYIKTKGDPYSPYFYRNKEFVEYDDSDPTVCRSIPTDFPEDFPNYSLDYHFGSKPTDVDDKRETGVDRFPVSKNTKVVTKNTPITIYTDVVKDSGNNTIKDVNGNPTCANIYSPAIVTGGFTLNDGHKPPTPDKQARYTPIPYTKVVNYGTSVANKTNSLYYSLRKEPGILE
jgi:hypothetical protein